MRYSKEKPSEVLLRLLGYLTQAIEEGLPEYLLEQQVQEARGDISEEVLESVMFLYEYDHNALRAFRGSPNRVALDRALDEFADGTTNWASVVKIWELYIEEAQAIESTLMHSERELTHKGFKVRAIQTPDRVLTIFYGAIDFLVDLFQTKGVEIDLHQLVKEFVFRPVHKGDNPKSIPGGLYTAGDKQVSLFWGSRSGIAPDKTAEIKRQVYNLVHYVLVHELCHAIYFHSLSKDAREFWADDWKSRAIEISPDNPDVVLNTREEIRERLKDLGIPTDYGHTNPSEDFAETLTHYLFDNDSLKPYALNRLLGTLRHSSNPSRIFKAARRILTAATYKEIVKNIDPKIVNSAESIKAVSDEYKEKLGKEPIIFRVGDYEVKVDSKEGDIRLSCSCDYWRYQGPEYHADKNSYLLGKARGTLEAPTKRDPKNTHKVCKHAYAVLRDFFGE